MLPGRSTRSSGVNAYRCLTSVSVPIWRDVGQRPPVLSPQLRIPGRSGQGFRFDQVTHSNLIRSPIPGHPVTLSG